MQRHGSFLQCINFLVATNVSNIFEIQSFIENYRMRSLINYTLHRILLDYQMKENEVSRTYSIYDRDEKCIQKFTQKY